MVYRPMGVRMTDPPPPEIPLQSVIAHRDSLPASVVFASFQTGDQPVSCRVPPPRTIPRGADSFACGTLIPKEGFLGHGTPM